MRVPRGEPIFRKEDCSPMDIGVVLDHATSFSNLKKLHFIENVWSPLDLSFHRLSNRENLANSNVHASTVPMASVFQVL